MTEKQLYERISKMEAANILVCLSNVMASLILLFYYLLFFAKGFTPHIRKLLSIIIVFLVIHVFIFITEADLLVVIAVLGILPVVDIFCCSNRIYNLFMIIPAFLFYVLTAIFPMFLIPLITRNRPDELYGVSSLTFPGLIFDFLFTVLLIGTYVLCRRRKIDLCLKFLEVAGFLVFFIFALFMLLSIGVYNNALDFKMSVVFDSLATFFMLAIFLAYWSYLIIARDRANMKRDAVHAQNYIAMQIESLESEETNRQEIKILKHDLRNHLQVIQEMCNTKQYAQMESYISELSGNPMLSKSFCITGNPAADTVISIKKAHADNAGIRLICDGDFAWLSNLSPIDVCAVFSNLLDNALEGSIDAVNPYIAIKGNDHAHFYALMFSNNVPENIKIINNSVKTSKKDRKHHGFGLSSINSVVRKYNGSYTLKCRDMVFSVQAVFPKK